MQDVERLAHRVVMGAFRGPELPGWFGDLLDSGLGAVCLFSSNVADPEQLAELTARLHERGSDLLVATDEEGGDVTRLHVRKGSPYPGNAALGAVDDVDLTERVARAIGGELAGAGIDLNLAPVADVNSNPRNPVIGVRSFGRDPALVARHTAAYVTGLQSAGVAACAKHFPGHGDTTVDSHRALPRVDAARDTLRDRELPPFHAAVSAGAVAVMTAHLVVPALGGRGPATLSPSTISVLRDDLGFAGLIVTDALDMAGVSAGRGVPAAAVQALAAGCDLLCLGADKDVDAHRAVVQAVVAAVGSGDLPAHRLAHAASRVDRAVASVRQLRRGRRADVDDPSLDVARRAVRIRGRLPQLSGATVLRLRTGTNAVVGDVAWGLPPDGAVLAGRPVVDVWQSTSYDDIRSAVADRPVVVLVREAHRHPWALALLDRLARRDAALVVADMGWPADVALPGAAVVTTFGASRAHGVALDELLSEARAAS